MTSGVNQASDSPAHGYIRYQVPQYWMMLGRTRGQRSLRDNVAKKASSQYHLSSRKFLHHSLPYFRQILNDEKIAVTVCARLELDQDEVAFLLGVKKDSARARKVHDAAKIMVQRESSERIAEFGGFGLTQPEGAGKRENDEDNERKSGLSGLKQFENDDSGEVDDPDDEDSKDQRTLFEFQNE